MGIRSLKAIGETHDPQALKVTRSVRPLREGGSLPAIVEADDEGLNVIKLSAASSSTPGWSCNARTQASLGAQGLTSTWPTSPST
jgi:hypothetical protein